MTTGQATVYLMLRIKDRAHREQITALDLADNAAERTLLEELHRLHLAVSTQRKELEKLHRDRANKKKAHRKPVDARSPRSKTRETRSKRP